MIGLRNSDDTRNVQFKENIDKDLLKQIADIELIRDTDGLESLPLPLREMAQVRLDHPEAPLKDLGKYMDPPVGKSGINHRLRKLSAIADTIREARGIEN